MKTQILTLAALALCGACVELRREAPETMRHLLELAPPEAPATGPTGRRARVGTVHVAPAFTTTALVYREAEGRYREDFYHAWLVPPDQMFTRIIIEHLRTSGLFETVQRADSELGGAAYRLETDVSAFFGDAAAEPYEAVLGLRVLFIDEAERSLLLQKAWNLREPWPERDADGLVQAQERALERVLSQLEKALGSALASP